MALTKKQAEFAFLRSQGVNATEAYRKSYDPKTMSSKSINEVASRLSRHPKITSRIAELTAPALRIAELSVERTIQELARGAYSDPEAAPTWSDKISCLDKVMKHQGLYERDNKQRAENIAIQIVLV